MDIGYYQGLYFNGLMAICMAFRLKLVDVEAAVWA